MSLKRKNNISNTEAEALSEAINSSQNNDQSLENEFEDKENKKGNKDDRPVSKKAKDKKRKKEKRKFNLFLPIKNLFVELKKIEWCSFKDMIKYTGIALLIGTIMALILWGLNSGAAEIVSLVKGAF